ncbi:hypothetical protein Tco_0703715, partial [Tanacetum coccineum]
CLFFQHGRAVALDSLLETLADAEKTSALKICVYKKAHCALLLCLDNKVLREVNKEDSTARLLTLENVLSTLNSRELKKRTYAKDNGDGLFVRGRITSRKVIQKNKKKSTSFVKKNVGHGSGMHSKGYNNSDLLMAVSEEMFLEWIMDYGGFYHMTRRRDFLFDFNMFNGGTVLLGDNRTCAMRGTENVKVQMNDGSSCVLENVCYIPELKISLIIFGTVDREGYIMELGNERVNVIKGSFDGFFKNCEGKLCVFLGWLG